MENVIITPKKPKYNDEDTKKEGSPIETPYKYSDTRRVLRDLFELEDEDKNK